MIKLFTTSVLLLVNMNSNINVHQNNSTIKDWSESKLTFDDFKATPKSKTGIKGEFSTKISWTVAEQEGALPIYKMYNKMDSSKSWMNKKHDELLKEYQFCWDLGELYTRKIRKDIELLNKNKVHDKEKYKATITKHVLNYRKQRAKYDGVLYNQPDLYKIINKQYQDSLNLYKGYKI